MVGMVWYKDVLIEVILLPMNVAYFRRVLLTSFQHTKKTHTQVIVTILMM